MDTQMEEDSYMNIDNRNASSNSNNNNSNNNFQLLQPTSNIGSQQIDSDIELRTGPSSPAETATNYLALSEMTKNEILDDDIANDNKDDSIIIKGDTDIKNGNVQDVENDSELEYESEEVEIEVEPTYVVKDTINEPKVLNDEGDDGNVYDNYHENTGARISPIISNFGNSNGTATAGFDNPREDSDSIDYDDEKEVDLNAATGEEIVILNKTQGNPEPELRTKIEGKQIETIDECEGNLIGEDEKLKADKEELKPKQRESNVEGNEQTEPNTEEPFDDSEVLAQSEIEDPSSLEEEIKEFEESSKTKSPSAEIKQIVNDTKDDEIILLSDTETSMDQLKPSTRTATSSSDDDDIQIVNEVELSDNKSKASSDLHRFANSNKLRSHIPVYVDLITYVYKLYQPTTKEDPAFAELPVLFDSPKEILYCSLNRAILLIKSRMSPDEQGELILNFKDLNDLRISEDDINGTYCTINDIIGIFDDLRERSESKEFHKFIQIEVEIKPINDRFINKVRYLLSCCGDGKCLDDLDDENNDSVQEGTSSDDPSAKRKVEDFEDSDEGDNGPIKKSRLE